MSERSSAWDEIINDVLPKACARQARESGRAIALAQRCGMSADAIGEVIDDSRREYDLLVMAQQKLAEMLASGQLAGAEQRHDLSPVRRATLALNPALNRCENGSA
jgi:hypothetical protein